MRKEESLLSAFFLFKSPVVLVQSIPCRRLLSKINVTICGKMGILGECVGTTSISLLALRSTHQWCSGELVKEGTSPYDRFGVKFIAELTYVGTLLLSTVELIASSIFTGVALLITCQKPHLLLTATVISNWDALVLSIASLYETIDSESISFEQLEIEWLPKRA